jgi:branched-chain amino acid aminotransferase
MNVANLGRAADNSFAEAYIRILVTRGIGDLTYDPAATPHPSVIVIVKPAPIVPEDHYRKGVKVCMVDVIRNHPRSVSPLIKSNNLLNNALGMQQALKRGGIEGVFRNYRGELSECSQSNLFIVKDGVVRTPTLEAGLLAGITRAFVMEMCSQLGLSGEEGTLLDQDLFTADEAFFTSTTKELVPVVQVDNRTIGNGSPGPVTKKLLAEYRRLANELTAAAVR